MEGVVDELVHCTGCHVQPSIRRSIVDENFPVGFGYPAVTEGHIANISYALFPARAMESAGRRMSNHLGLIQAAQKHVEYVSQSGGSITHSMGKVQPSFRGLDGRRALAVLHFLDRVILPIVNDDFFLDDGLLDSVCQSPSNPSPLPA